MPLDTRSQDWLNKRAREIKALEDIRDSLRLVDPISAVTMQGVINRIPTKYQDTMRARMGHPYMSPEVIEEVKRLVNLS